MADQESAACQELLQRCRAASIDVSRGIARTGETEAEMASRFLQARNWKMDDAIKMLSEDIQWRVDHDVDGLLRQTPEQILGIPLSLMEKYLPSYALGVDKEMRPVVYQKYGGMEVWKLTEKGATIESLVRYHIYQQEKISEELARLSAQNGRRIMQVTSVIDANGWHVGLATPDAMRFLKGIADADSAHYPCRMGVMFVINAPLVLSGVWRIIKSWLAPATRERVKIISYEKYWRPELQTIIDVSQLSDEYGGTNKRPEQLSH